MEDARLPKYVLYGELVSRSRPVGRPMLRYQDVCKRDMKSAEINPDLCEAAEADRSYWHRSSGQVSREPSRRGSSCVTTEGNGKEHEQYPYPCGQQRTYAATVAETDTQELDSTVTVDAAPIQ